MADNDRGNGNDEEGKRLRSVSIPQLFAWTGLAKRGEKRQKTNSTQLPHLTDLALWNVLGFAVDETDYSNVALVCKDWKTFVNRLCPPQLFHMSSLMKRGGLIGTEGVDLFRPVFESLKDPFSPLYRSVPETACPPHVPQGCKAWPDLQPQFNVVLMRFVVSICTQRSPHNHQRELHNLTCTFFEVFAAQISNEIWKIISEGERQGPSWSNALCVVDELMSFWRVWEGVVQTVADVTGYLDRYYVKHHSLPFLQENACRLMGTQLLQRLKNEDVTSSTPMRLLHQVSSLKGQQDWKPDDFSLLLRFSRALDGMSSSFPSDDALDAIKQVYNEEVFPLLEVALGQAREEESKELKNQSESCASRGLEGADHVKIVSMPERVTFVFTISSHFLASSGFLQKLKLKGGEFVRLDANRTMLEKAVRFYELDEADPLGEMERPLQSSNMEDIVGQPFASFIDEFSQTEVFELIIFANLMDMKGLLDLTAAKVASMMKGRTPAEIREIFNISNDFAPEEEAQIREENKWSEEA